MTKTMNSILTSPNASASDPWPAGGQRTLRAVRRGLTGAGVNPSIDIRRS